MLEGLAHLWASGRGAKEVVRDLIDIAVVAFLVYRALLVLKGTRAMQMGIGLLAFGVLYLVAKYAELATVLSLLSWLAGSAILIIVVVFQNDIRRALIRLGAKAWLARGRDAQERVIDEVVAAATELARHRMGALICLERDANVLEFVKSEGIELDGEVTRDLLVSLFVPEAVNKLHDGAVLVRDLRIARAGVFLPMPEVTKVADHSLGSRHRAAIGITEETDAVVIVVSEERGTITLCFPNGMVQNVDATSLKQALLGLFGRSSARPRSFAERIGLARASRPGKAPAGDRAAVSSKSASKSASGRFAAIERSRPASAASEPPPEEEEQPASQLLSTKPMDQAEVPAPVDEPSNEGRATPADEPPRHEEAAAASPAPVEPAHEP